MIGIADIAIIASVWSVTIYTLLYVSLDNGKGCDSKPAPDDCVQGVTLNGNDYKVHPELFIQINIGWMLRYSIVLVLVLLGV